MGGSITCVLGVVLLFVGTLAAVVVLKNGSRSIENAQIVPFPAMGGPLHNGPWPGCLGLEGSKCQSLIESYASDTVGNIEIVTPDMVEMLADDFDTHRVRIYVDADGIVVQSPVRGR